MLEGSESIMFRSGLSMGGIVLLALLSMISSVFIAASSQGDTVASNENWSRMLAMRAYMHAAGYAKLYFGIPVQLTGASLCGSNPSPEPAGRLTFNNEVPSSRDRPRA